MDWSLHPAGVPRVALSRHDGKTRLHFLAGTDAAWSVVAEYDTYGGDDRIRPSAVGRGDLSYAVAVCTTRPMNAASIGALTYCLTHRTMTYTTNIHQVIGIQMQRCQIYLTQSHLGHLAAYARARGTSHSALIREALDEYLARQAPLDKRVLRREAFGAWAPNDGAPTVEQLRSEERRFDRPAKQRP